MNKESISQTLAELPISEAVPDVLSGLQGGNVLLHAEPGAGKSTGLPLALLQDYSSHQKIIMLEPRRLAARNVAERLSFHLNEPLGKSIGLRMRGQTKVSRDTRLEVVTEGVLTRLLQADPGLEGIGLVIFDEFHERSLHADLGLALCLEVQHALRDDLRLLLMSATLDAEQLSSHLDGAEQVNCEGRQHPVSIHWLGEPSARHRQGIAQSVAQAVTKAMDEETGDVLVFLPGVAEIEQTARMLGPRLGSDSIIYRLHGGVDSKTSRAATAASTPGQRKIILSTSIAETSITIDGVRVVIDSGLERRGRVDTSTGAVKLETVMASQASATQRSGRAGRTAPGHCYRLWSEAGHARRQLSWQAEIMRADLAPLLMEMGQWGVKDINELRWLEPPPESAIARAKDLLEYLGIWKDNGLTEHGRLVARLPVHPRLGHMMLWSARHQNADAGCKLAVLLEEGDRKRQQTDLEVEYQVPLQAHLKKRVFQLKSLLADVASDQSSGKEVSTSDSNSKPPLAVLLAQAYPDWVAQLRHQGNSQRGQNQNQSDSDARYQLACGAGAVIREEDALAHSAWLVVAQLGGSSQQARIFSACRLDINELEVWSPELVTHNKRLEWDDRAERVMAEEQTLMGELIISAKPVTQVSSSEKADALMSGIARRGIECLPWNEETREWQARVQLMASVPDHLSRHNWPAVDDKSLEANLEQWLRPYLDGVGSLKGLAKLDLPGILSSMLDYPQQQELNEFLPQRYLVPSGSRIRLRYSCAGNPVLSVKLQELFGLQENPAVARGTIPLTVELLSPARRPIQITEDLSNFWSSSYHDVRKEMAGRYPKHDWPLDPLSAQPTSRAKPRKR